MDIPPRLQGLSLHVLPLHQSLATSATSTEFVLLRVTAPMVSAGKLPRLTSVLALDVSGSMQGAPILQVKDSVARLSTILGDEDGLGVVSFSNSAATVAPIRPLAQPAAREAVTTAADGLFADGSTNISAGLAHSALLFPPRADDEQQIILLLSDGQPNVGTRTADGLSREVELIKSRGIAVSVLGYGAQHNEDTLLAMAEAGGGRYAYVKDPLMAAPSFARALGAQRDVIAEGVQLTLSPGPGVEIIRFLGDVRSSFGDGGLHVKLSDLLLGEEVNVVAELQVQSRRETGRWRLLNVSLSAHPAGRSGELSSRAPILLREELTVHVSPGGAGPADGIVLEMVAMATAAEQRKKARGFADQRNFVSAAACLRQARDALFAVHNAVPKDGSALRDVYEAILDDLQVAEKAPAPEEYQVLRKAQLDQQSLSTNFGRGSSTSASMTPSAQHMVIRLRNTHGLTPLARLVCIEGEDRGRVVQLGPECRIGRGNDNDYVISDNGATRRHALIQWVGRTFVAHDLGSSNGTFVNGKHIVDDQPLKDGDIITIGKTRLRFEGDDKKPPQKDL